MDRHEQLLDPVSREKLRDFKVVWGGLIEEGDTRVLRRIKRNVTKYIRSDSMDYMNEMDAADEVVEDPAARAYQKAIATYDTLGEWETTFGSIVHEMMSKFDVAREEHKSFSRDHPEWDRHSTAYLDLLGDMLKIGKILEKVCKFLDYSRSDFRGLLFDEMWFFNNKENRAVERAFEKPFPKSYRPPPLVSNVVRMKFTANDGEDNGN